MANSQSGSDSGFWRIIRSIAVAVLLSRVFILCFILSVLFISSIVVARGLARDDAAFKIASVEKSVLFSINGSPNFIAASAANSRKKYFPYLPEKDMNQILACRNVISSPNLTMWNDSIFSSIRESLAGNLWIADLTSVSRRFPSFIVVTMRLHRPFAAIQRTNGTLYTDDRGLLLPMPDLTDASSKVVLISGISVPPPAVGQKWSSTYLDDALALMKFLNDGLSDYARYSRLLDMIESIECEPAHVTMRTGKPSMTIQLRPGSRIIWDMHVEESNVFARPSKATKLRGLRTFLDKVEDLTKLSELDFSFNEPVVTFKKEDNGEK